jgi:serine/threonine protein kinase
VATTAAGGLPPTAAADGPTANALQHAAAADVEAATSNANEAGAAAVQPAPPSFSWTRGELLGQGSFGRVYQALVTPTGELIAVKQVEIPRDEALRSRAAEHVRALEKEVQVLGALQHTNIVRYLGTERSHDALSIFLELVPGGSIASLVSRYGPLPEPVIRTYAKQVRVAVNMTATANADAISCPAS